MNISTTINMLSFCFNHSMFTLSNLIVICYFFLLMEFNIFLFIYGSMSYIDGMINSKMISEDLCLADSCTTHTILRDKKYFQNLILNKASVNTISGLANLIEGSGRANIILPK
jgi:hypothetical protein